jgi:NADPH:quinone reductase-like Zn-dependent oxidoreductase
MKLYHITAPTGLGALKMVEGPEPTCGPSDVLVDMQAWSLNYRDLSMPRGGYLRNDKIRTAPPLVPLSDGAGEVIAVGSAVTRFRVGDRVAATFFQEWLDGDLTDQQISSALGGAADGVLAERCAFHEDGLVHIPSAYSFEQAATLPCAAVTAWQALTLGHCRPEHTVLMLGTGGVSIFALQFAKAFGARTIITSSHDDKLERARQLGADETINYKTHPEWQVEVERLTNGRGVDHVIEVGGAGTLERSLASTRVSGRVSLIGVLTGQPEHNPSPMLVLFKRLTLQGIYVGSRAMFEAMNRLITEQHIEPVIDRVFAFEDVRAAYEALAQGQHFGKLVISRRPS